MDALIELFSFEGRANRAWYLWHVILDDLAVVTMAILLVVIGVVSGSPLVILPLAGALIAGVWAATAVTVKRFHDLGQSGWLALTLLVPLLNIYFGLTLVFKKGVVGPNQYGPDPLEAAKASGYLEP